MNQIVGKTIECGFWMKVWNEGATIEGKKRRVKNFQLTFCLFIITSKIRENMKFDFKLI